VSSRREALEALWAQVPDVGCRGLCSSSCGPIVPARLEVRVLEGAAGRRLTTDETGTRCSMLADGRCTAYAARPLICRLWGACEDMRCPWGCRPPRGVALLTRAQALDLLGAALALGGEDGSEVQARSTRAVARASQALDAIEPASPLQRVLDERRGWRPR
jgi:hypothetical protein